MTNNNILQWAEATEAVNEAASILIVTHLSPDGDAIGSLLGLTLALRAHGKKVDAVVDGTAGAEDERFDALGPRDCNRHAAGEGGEHGAANDCLSDASHDETSESRRPGRFPAAVRGRVFVRVREVVGKDGARISRSHHNGKAASGGTCSPYRP